MDRGTVKDSETVSKDPKGYAMSDPEIRHAICLVCGKRGLISKMTGKCVGSTMNTTAKGDKRVLSRMEACRKRAKRQKSIEERRKPVDPAPVIQVLHDWTPES